MEDEVSKRISSRLKYLAIIPFISKVSFVTWKYIKAQCIHFIKKRCATWVPQVDIEHYLDSCLQA